MRKTAIAGDFVPSTPRIYRFRLMNRQENERAGHLSPVYSLAMKDARVASQRCPILLYRHQKPTTVPLRKCRSNMIMSSL